MRLLFVHERMGAQGGAEANLLATAGELARRGHVVGLLHGPSTGRETDAWEHTFSHRFPLNGAGRKSTVESAMTGFRPDVTYVHNISDLDVLRSLTSAPRPSARMVHDHNLYCMRSYKYHYRNRRICTRPASAYCILPCGASLARNPGGRFPLKWVSYLAKRREIESNRHFNRLIVATAYMKGELLRNGFDSHRIEIHPPVPPSSSGPVTSSFSERNRLVYSGQIIRGKGVDVLLESLARVKSPFECLIFGEGSHRSLCESLCRRLGLQDRVRFMGFVSPREIQNHYREASVAVVSSVWPEPFGAVGLEAMRCGLPVVAFDAGGIREWLSNGLNGYLVRWMDRSQYAARVDALLENKTLARRMGECGRGLADERFNFTRYVNGLETLLERTAVEQPRPARGS